MYKKAKVFFKAHPVIFALSLTAFLLLLSAVLFLALFLRRFSPRTFSYNRSEKKYTIGEEFSNSIYKGIEHSPSSYVQDFGRESVSLKPASRKTEEDLTISLKVDDVAEAVEQIASSAQSKGGFVVYKNINTKSNEGQPYSYSTISVRVPKDVAQVFIDEAKKFGIEVISESANLRDITDEYENIEEKLKLLEKNKARFEEIMNQATTIDEILRVQNQIISLQNQIDSLRGRQKYLEDLSKSVKITFYLSTDEYALPYVPKDNWSLKAVFTKAVRSFVKTTRALISLLIWVAVYSPLWVSAWLLLKRVKKKFK